LFRFPREFVLREGFLADWQRTTLCAALGAVMLIDYQQSDVGPYRELLFMPGRMKLGGRTLFSISKIYVSTPESVVNGIENWGIPKQLADFERVPLGEGGECFRVAIEGRECFSAQLESFGPRFPLSTALIPIAIGQERRGDLVVTRPIVKGTGRLCRVRDLRVSGSCFPDVARLKPIAVVAVKDFHMTFPVPGIVQGYFGTRQFAVSHPEPRTPS
jgi:hypothetical protein